MNRPSSSNTRGVSRDDQKQERNMVNQIKTFIEPLLIALLAVGVGFIIISVLIPMFGIYSQI